MTGAFVGESEKVGEDVVGKRYSVGIDVGLGVGLGEGGGDGFGVGGAI